MTDNADVGVNVDPGTPTPTDTELMKAADAFMAQPVKRKRGRPVGSKNKPKVPVDVPDGTSVDAFEGTTVAEVPSDPVQKIGRKPRVPKEPRIGINFQVPVSLAIKVKFAADGAGLTLSKWLRAQLEGLNLPEVAPVADDEAVVYSDDPAN